MEKLRSYCVLLVNPTVFYFHRLAGWIDSGMSWLLNNLDGFFDAVGFVILQVVLGFEKIFLFVPWFVWIPLIPMFFNVIRNDLKFLA